MSRRKDGSDPRGRGAEPAGRGRLARVVRQGLRFGTVGGVATAVHVLAAWIAARGVGLAPQWANLAGFGCAVSVSYLGHYHWTFGLRGSHGTPLRRFLVVAAFGWGASGALTWALAGRGPWGMELALLAILLVVPPLTWALSAAWAFRQRVEATPLAGGEGEN